MSAARRFVVIGQTALASAEFSLDDLPGSSGRLDVLLRCVRAALLVSHGVRTDTVAYLVLGGGPRAPRTIRIDGAAVEYLRPDERSLAGAIRSMLGWADDQTTFVKANRGISIVRGGLEAVLADLGPCAAYVLEPGGHDVRDASLELSNAAFFVGDHRGFDVATRARLAGLGARSVSVGPVAVHADDAITIVANEIDRRQRSTP